MRTGPLVERGVHAARSTKTSSSTARCTPAASRARPRIKPSPPSSKQPSDSNFAHFEYRLPINLREFIADQLGTVLHASDDAVLTLAENADEATLSKLARAIRRYSTKRAQQAWHDRSISLTAFITSSDQSPTPIALCLRCAKIEFGTEATAIHRSTNCVAINLSEAQRTANSEKVRPEPEVAAHLRKLIEEFRRLRAAFGLPHFKLDCYVHGDHVTFTWRPLT